MSASKFHIEELDEKSRRYLYEVNLSKGKGISGTYAPTPFEPGTWIVFYLGLFLFLFVPLMLLTKDFILNEPTPLAMLQTAFFIVGLCLFIMPLRMWIFQKSPLQAGFFLFLDSKFMWECYGRQVRVLPINSIQEFEISRNPGKAKGGLVKITTSKELRTINLCKYYNAQAIKYHLEENFHGKRTDMVQEIPDPIRQGREKWEFKTLFAWFLVAVIVFLTFQSLNLFLRDATIWNSIQEVHPESGRIYWLRLYLREPRNIQHREEAAATLDKLYQNKLLALQNIQVEKYELPDPELFAGLESILRGMGKSLEPPFLKFSLKFSGDEDEANKAWGEATQKYAETLFNSVGEDFVIVVGPTDPPAHIEITCDWVTLGIGLGLKFVVQYRLNPSREPFKTVTWVEKVTGKNPEQAGLAAKALAHRTANYPPPIDEDDKAIDGLDFRRPFKWEAIPEAERIPEPPGIPFKPKED